MKFLFWNSNSMPKFVNLMIFIVNFLKFCLQLLFVYGIVFTFFSFRLNSWITQNSSDSVHFLMKNANCCETCMNSVKILPAAAFCLLFRVSFVYILFEAFRLPRDRGNAYNSHTEVSLPKFLYIVSPL